MVALNQSQKIYEGDGDQFMTIERTAPGERIMMIPDAMPGKVPDTSPHIRIMWGQHLLEDLLLGRYRSFVCAVNTRDNSRGIIGQLAALLPTTQWNEQSVTAYAVRFSAGVERVKIVKYEMDMLEVLAILRPPGAAHLTVDHLVFGVPDHFRDDPASHDAAAHGFGQFPWGADQRPRGRARHGTLVRNRAAGHVRIRIPRRCLSRAGDVVQSGPGRLSPLSVPGGAGSDAGRRIMKGGLEGGLREGSFKGVRWESGNRRTPAFGSTQYPDIDLRIAQWAGRNCGRPARRHAGLGLALGSENLIIPARLETQFRWPPRPSTH